VVMNAIQFCRKVEQDENALRRFFDTCHTDQSTLHPPTQNYV